jgi:hypothetical protein
MAKLPANVQEAAAKADPSTGFSVVPEKIYRVRCTACKLDTPTADGSSRKAQWELEIEEEGVRKAKLWQDVSHEPTAAGLMHGAFDAFGLTLDSADDEFVGECCLADVGIRIAEKGKYAGQKQNFVKALLPLQGAVAAGNGQAPATAGTAAAPAADPWAQ